MEQIKEFTITRVKMQGFKSFIQEGEFHLGRTTYIFGANGQGKTTIADAIAYAFCGTPFWGEKSTERLISRGVNKMCVEVEFVDTDGEIHTLIRRRNGKETSITLDSHQLRQTDLINLFVEKDIFLSILNPLYFIEKIAGDGREFLQKLLPPISQEQVLAALDEQSHDLLEKESLLDPEYYIKTKREKLKEVSQEGIYLSGQLALLEEQLKINETKKNTLEVSIKQHKAKIASVMKKQFEGIDVEAVSQAYEEAKKSSSADEMLALEKKRIKIQDRQYDSKFSDEISKTDAELMAAYSEYNRLFGMAKGIRPGVPCPTCAHILTNAEFNSVKTDMMKELNEVKTKGKNLKTQLDDLMKLDTQAKAQFLQYQTDDLKKIDAEIKTIKSKTTADIDKLHDILTFGNFSEAQLNTLEAMKAELFAEESELKAMRSDDELRETIASIELQIKDSEVQKQHIQRLITAANEYAVKRAEMMLSPLKMDRASIKLFDVVKTTGEIKSTFKFTFDHKDYRWLSSSERIKAGLEVAELLKHLTGLVYPTFIDNAECINTSFSRADGQMIFAFVKKCALTVKEPSSVEAKEAA